MSSTDRSSISSQSRSAMIADTIEGDRGTLVGDASPLLPPIRDLCARFAAAPNTVVEALRELETRGVVRRTAAGRYVHIRSAGWITGRPPAVTLTAKKRIADTLHREVLSGEYHQGNLPLIKQLAVRFGCNHRTVRGALALLESRGVLQRAGRQFVVAHTAAFAPTGRHVHITGSRQVFEHLSVHHAGVIRGAERALAELGWPSRRILVSDNPAEVSDLKNPAPLGYIHLFDYPYAAWRDFFRARHESQGTPVIILTSVDGTMEGAGIGRDAFLRTIATDNHAAGTEVGFYLRALGHKRIAFFTHVGVQSEPTAASDLERTVTKWAQNRWNGLCEVHPPESLRLFDGSLLLSPPPRPVPGGIERLRRMLSATEKIPTPVLSDAAAHFYRAASIAGIADRMRPLFEEAIEDRGITAWVCCNDDVAVAAKAFLSAAGITTPDHLALLGFDNSSSALRLDLTSYDLGFWEMGHLAVNALAHPGTLTPDTTGKILVRGRLAVRGSS